MSLRKPQVTLLHEGGDNVVELNLHSSESPPFLIKGGFRGISMKNQHVKKSPLTPNKYRFDLND